MAISLGGIGAAVSGGSALAGLFGGGSKQPAAPQGYQPQYQAWTDQSVQSAMANLGQYNTAGQTIGQAGQAAQGLYNNPYAPSFQQGSNAAAGAGWDVGGQQIGAGQNLMNSGQSLLPWQQQILQTGFDPMNNIYNTQSQINIDQTRAGLAARGIAMSPYGAGVENQSNMMFNQNWQNNLLNRQNTAAQGAGYLGNSAANQINLGQNVSTLGLNTLGQSVAQPYNAAQTIGTNQLGALGTYGQFGTNATNTAQGQIGDWLQYLGLGQTATQNQNAIYGNELKANQQQFSQNQQFGKDLGSSLSGLGTWYGKSGASGNLGRLY